MSDMGTFRTTIVIENPLRRGDKRALPDTLVDTGAELMHDSVGRHDPGNCQ